MTTIQGIDWVLAIGVIYCIWTGFKCKRDWLIYSVLCFAYVFISAVKELYGLTALNLFAALFALKHFLEKKK